MTNKYSQLQLKPELDSEQVYASSYTAGRYEVRFARSNEEIAAAQALRCRVLYIDGGGKTSSEMDATGREVDQWDDVAFHIIVLDRKTIDGEAVVVGTLRLVSSESLKAGQGLYTEKAFDIASLHARYGKLLELSRFCIDPAGRSGSILMLIWKFTMRFIVDHRFRVMLGCASFPGTNVGQHTQIFSYLYRHNLAPEHLMPKPVADPGQCVALASLQNETDAGWNVAKKAVPTLLRGYLKLGAKISDTAIIDPVFNTTFVCIYVDASAMVASNNSPLSNKMT